MKKKLYSAILASIMVIGSICGVAIPVYAKEETKIIDGNDSYDTATYLDVNGNVYATQSATFKEYFDDICNIFLGEDVSIIKKSGKTNAGRDYVYCTLA